MQVEGCEISQMESRGALWEISHMAKVKLTPGVSAHLIDLLENVRPEHPERPGKPISDNRWCEDAGVSTGFWRDLRKGAVPSIDNVERMARVAGLRLSELIEGVEPLAHPIPSESELAVMLEQAQREVPVERLTLGGYPSAVAAALRSRLQQYAETGASGLSVMVAPSTAPEEGALSPSPTKKSVRG